MAGGDIVLVVPAVGGVAGIGTRKESPPLAELAPDPPEAETWQVKFYSDDRRFNSGDPLVIRIPRAPSALSRAMTRELRAAYEVLGWPGVANFGAGVFGLDAYTRFLQSDGLDAKSLRGPAEGDAAIERMDKAVEADRKPLWDAYVAARRALDMDVALMERKITAAAHEIATLRIARCRAVAINEAQRYLSLAEPKAASARSFLAGGEAERRAQGQVGLSGPEGSALRAAVRLLAPLTAEVSSSQKTLLVTRASDVVNSTTGQINPVALSLLTSLMPLVQAATAAAKAVSPDADATARAATRLAKASEAHSSEFARLAGGYPVLFRLAEEDGADEAALARAVVEVLQDTWSAAQTMERELAAAATPKESVVWTMPMLIDLTVRQRFGGDSGFAERVAADLLRVRGTKIGPCALINMFISGVDASLMLVPVAPLQLAVAIVSLIGNLAELAEDWVKDTGKRAGNRMALEPQLALSADPSALGFAVQAVVTALSILPVPFLAAETKAWRLNRLSQ